MSEEWTAIKNDNGLSISPSTQRLKVPSGWLYRTYMGNAQGYRMVFVPAGKDE